MPFLDKRKLGFVVPVADQHTMSGIFFPLKAVFDSSFEFIPTESNSSLKLLRAVFIEEDSTIIFLLLCPSCCSC
jgi:hypothetical protein